MRQIRISRRDLVRGMLAAPFISVAGCGSGSSGTASNTQTCGDGDPNLCFGAAAVIDAVPGDAVPAVGPASVPGQVNTVFAYFSYSGYSSNVPDSVQTELLLTPIELTTTSDRLGDGGLCYQFNGTSSSVLVDALPIDAQPDYAVLLWVRSESQSQMELLRLAGSNGSTLVIEVNEAGEISVTVTGSAPATVAAGTGYPSLTDGAWHHLAVQKYGSQLQVFIDGILCAGFAVGQGLPGGATALIGQSWSGAIDGVRLYNRAFPAGGLAMSVYSWTQLKAGTQSATGSLAAYYPFNGNAQNYLGYGVEGILNNVTPTADRNGTANSAFLFNGSTSSIMLNQPFSSTTGPFAIAFWAQSTAATPMTALSATAGGPAGVSLDIVFNGPAALQVYINGSAMTGMAVGSTGGLTDGKWHFVVLQDTGGTLELFVDGALEASASSSAIFFGSESVMQFGAGSAASSAVSHLWNGALDDIQIYETSLTAQQIAAVQAMDYLPRDGAGPLVFQGKLWLLGGWNPAFLPVTNSEVWCSVDGVVWTMVAVAPWPPRHDAGYAVLNDKMWVVGGDRNTGNYQNDVWCSSDGINWQQVTDDAPWGGRATQYVLAFNNRLWLMGGQQIFETTVPPVIAYNDVWSSADGANWELVTPSAAWSPRGLIMGNVVFQGKMWVIGGGQYDIRTFNNDVWSSPDGANWTQVLAQAPWTPRQYQCITVFDNKIWMMAGGDAESQGGLNDVWYSCDGILWTQLPGTQWLQRHASSTLVANGYLWLTCGSDVGGDNDVWKLGYAP